MVSLQNMHRILIRATDFSGSTSAKLQGVTLDVAVPKQAADTRPKALGIEQCHCPLKYNSTSCQDPGAGYYRWTRTEFTSSTTTYLDFIGDVKACQCNGRADKCHPEDGGCLNCRENTTGSACELCASGFYGNPLIGQACQPCQCPSAEHNHATTCSIDSRGQFMCQCREGYTGPKCDRCDYGYFGDSTLGCAPCQCNPLGSLSDQCDQETGQCYCVRGVQGRDCSQCGGQRQVLIEGGRCKNCNHDCVAPLLDTMDAIFDFYQPTWRILTLLQC